MLTLLIGTAARADDGGKAFLEPLKYLYDAYPYEDEAGDFNGDTYEYSIVFGLVRVGDTWKIDTMKPGKGDVVISDPGIQNGSRWNLGNLDYSAKVNEDDKYGMKLLCLYDTAQRWTVPTPEEVHPSHHAQRDTGPPRLSLSVEGPTGLFL